MSGQELVVTKALELSAQLKHLSSHRHLELLHFFMVCMLFRRDAYIKKGAWFPRQFKLASWLMSILMCFSDSIVSNLIIGEPVVKPFNNHKKIAIASLIWYLVNYSPRDLIFRISQIKLVNLVLTWLWTLCLIGKIHTGVWYGGKHYPKDLFIITLLGICKGSGHVMMNGFLKVLAGTYKETDNPILYPSLQLKCSIFTAVLFTMFKSNYFAGRTPFMYLGVVFLYLYSSISSVMVPGTSGETASQGARDEPAAEPTPREDVFSPIESLVTFLFFNNPLLNSHYHQDKAASTPATYQETRESDGEAKDASEKED